MGAIPKCLRNYDAAVRSAHPHYSFTALGPDAHRVTHNHALANGLGEVSPLAAVCELNGLVLMLGCSLGHNTSLHLAERRAALDRTSERQGAPVVRDGEREWVEFETLAHNDEDVADCAAAFAEAHPGHVAAGHIGAADATLYDQPALIDFAADWLRDPVEDTYYRHRNARPMRARALVLLLAVVTAGCLTSAPDARGGQVTACPIDTPPPEVEPVPVVNATVQKAPAVVHAVERAAATNEPVTVEF